MIENLELQGNNYVYYNHSTLPLIINHEVTDTFIKVTVVKYFKQHEVDRKTWKSKVTKKMSKEQIEEYILDVIDLFINKK